MKIENDTEGMWPAMVTVFIILALMACAMITGNVLFLKLTIVPLAVLAIGLFIGMIIALGC